ncbi:putative glucuronosyltransferase pgsip8 [Quercus suber]|uniref:Glucuronosyltransferase pgsip8 n=1 Tax=Quercus suber TaxID=58331 RepID=A0AAW0KVS7_QUESU
MGRRERQKRKFDAGFLVWVRVLVAAAVVLSVVNETTASPTEKKRNAYATMLYMGTPRDYEFYVATRVLLRSLADLHVDADLVVIAALDVPRRWVRALEQEDGAKVVSVENLRNPYRDQSNFDFRFKLTLNKLYAWSLVEYDRVVMLDADNLFLQRTDELFQCGQFCAVFINPCYFHTGLFVLQPSKEVFNDMVHELEIGRENPDGADQGFICSYYPNLLDRPMFHPPLNGTKLDGTYRLPLGYQMDASYYCISWHEQRRQTLGYAAEMPVVIIQSVIYLGILAMTRIARPNFSKLCYRRSDKNIFLIQTGLKIIAVWSILASYVLPFFIIPHTVHPVLGWTLYLFGSFTLCSVAINTFLLPMIAVLILWIGIFGSLLVMAYPWYPDGVVRALAVFGYAFCSAPFLWISIVKIMTSLQVSLEREAFFPKLGDSVPPSGFNKLY